MSMSTSIVAFRPADDEWQRMKAVWDACQNAGIPMPEKIKEFFGHEEPNEEGVVVDIQATGAAVEWNSGNSSGFEVDLKKIEKGVRFVRFYYTF